jgi:hypothetical protein
MSIFVKDDDVVTVEVHYVEDNGAVTVIEEANDKSVTLKVKFRRPDFATSQRMVASSTTIDQSGNPSVNLLMLQNNMLYFLAKEWDARETDVQEPESKDAEGKTVPGKLIKGAAIELNADNLSRLRVEIARGLVSRLLPVIGQIL